MPLEGEVSVDTGDVAPPSDTIEQTPDVPQVNIGAANEATGLQDDKDTNAASDADDSSRDLSEEPTEASSQAPELTAKDSREEQLRVSGGIAVEAIKIAKENGIYDTEEKAVVAEAALSSAFEGYLDPKTVLSALKMIEGHGMNEDALKKISETYNNIARRTFVEFDGKLQRLSDLEAEKATADETRGGEIDKAIAEGVYKTGEQVVDGAIQKEIPILETQVAKALKEKRSTEKESALLARLRHAREAKGEAGILIRLGALKELRSSGVVGLNDAITLGEATAPSARDLILQRLRDNGQTEANAQLIIQQIEKGDVAALAKAGYLKETGVDVAVYGRHLDDQEMQKMMNEILDMDTRDLFQKYGKDTGAIFLMLLMMGINSEQIKKMFGIG